MNTSASPCEHLQNSGLQQNGWGEPSKQLRIQTQQGFTLMELLVAISVGVVVVAVAMGIYRQVSHDEIRIAQIRQDLFKRILVMETLKRMGENRTRPFLLKDNQVFFSSNADILGYGSELIRLTSNRDTLNITIIPEIFMPESWKKAPLASFDQQGENAATWFYSENVPFFHASFHYLKDDVLQHLEIQDKKRPDYLKIVLMDKDDEKWEIVF